MADLFALSRAVIDEGKGTDQVGPINRIHHKLSELRGDIAVVEAFSHSIVLRTDDGLVAFDTSNPSGGSKVVSEIRRWSPDRFNTIVYTHGHVDHVGGCGAFVADASAHGHPAICICGHENVAQRFDRYRMTNGYNQVINERQFGQFRRRGYGMTEPDQAVAPFLPDDSPKPSLTYRDEMVLDVGGLRIELNHARGETDDHTISSSGAFPMRAIRRRCSAIRASGRQPCATWQGRGRNSFCRPMDFRSKGQTGSAAC